MQTMTLTVERLMEQAEQKTGLSDWGGEDFREPLERLLDSFKEENPGNPGRTFSFGYTVVDQLSRRLYIRENHRRRPEILEIPVERPLFVTGLPRTGTTVMHNLLSGDPGRRTLTYWELLFPYVRGDIKDNESWARHQTEQVLKAQYALKPELLKRHETRADGPEECFNLLKTTFTSIAWANEWKLPAYLKWFLDQEGTDSYRYYKTQLQLLLSRGAGNRRRLLLKCPSHHYNIDVILKVFPDANVVIMHRDPVESFASGLSLLSLFHEVDAETDIFIQRYRQYFKRSLQKVGDIDRGREERVKSVSYRRLMENPETVIREIYDRFDLTFTETHARSITGYLRDNPRHKHGTHSYSLEKFGLTEDSVKDEFSGYIEEYAEYL
jgi:hypothetical protein